MSTWMNGDGLFVKFGSAEGDLAKGGHRKLDGANKHVCEFIIDYTDLQSATYAVLGSAVAGTDGGFGVTIPDACRIEAVETLVETAFTSSGTIATAQLAMGLKKSSDRSTELDHDGFLTAAYVGTKLDAAGERSYQEVGTTGSGALIGTTISENGVICVAALRHANDPFTAGKLRVRIFYFYP
jgi:hypothetical protein